MALWSIARGQALILFLMPCRGLTFTQISQLVRDMAAGLEHMHGLGLAHHDLKPPNVLLFADATVPGGVRAKLADLGLAGPLEQTRLEAGRCEDRHWKRRQRRRAELHPGPLMHGSHLVSTCIVPAYSRDSMPGELCNFACSIAARRLR